MGARDAHRLGLRFLHQELNVLPWLSVAENLFLGRAYPTRIFGLIDWRALHDRALAVLAGFGVANIEPGAILGRLPIADQLIVKIASTFVEDGSRRGRLFVMNEPTAAVSSQEAERLFGVIAELKRRDCAIVYVSHRIDEVLRISDRITVLRDGVNEAPIPAAGATRALLIERMTGRTAPEASVAAATSSRAAVSLAVQGVAGLGLSDLSFELREGEILEVAGVGDAGGDRLLKCLFGGARTGEISIARRPMGASELSRSVLEGVAYSVRLLIEALESSSGVSATRLRHAGGGAGSAVWCQIRADVLDRSIDRVENLDSGVVGAAILAGAAAGVFASIEDASAHMVRPERTFEPNGALKGHYQEGIRPVHGALRKT